MQSNLTRYRDKLIRMTPPRSIWVITIALERSLFEPVPRPWLTSKIPSSISTRHHLCEIFHLGVNIINFPRLHRSFDVRICNPDGPQPLVPLVLERRVLQLRFRRQITVQHGSVIGCHIWHVDRVWAVDVSRIPSVGKSKRDESKDGCQLLPNH